MGSPTKLNKEKDTRARQALLMQIGTTA